GDQTAKSEWQPGSLAWSRRPDCQTRMAGWQPDVVQPTRLPSRMAAWRGASGRALFRKQSTMCTLVPSKTIHDVPVALLKTRVSIWVTETLKSNIGWPALPW